MSLLYWIGKYESDIECCNIFNGSITYYGSNRCGNCAFCQNNVRINSKLTDEYKEFVIKIMNKKLSEDNNCKFLFYNQSLAHEIIAVNPLFSSYIIAINTYTIITTLNNKLYNRLWLSNVIDTLPVKMLTKSECSYKNVKHIFPNYSRFVIQKNISSGGKGTYLLTSNNESCIFNELEEGELYIVSPYIENAYSINIHLCISDNCILQFPLSLQITKLVNHKILYCGSDYTTTTNMSFKIKNKIQTKVNKICEMLKLLGYKGVLGIDLIITNQHIYFIEINPRFQGSSMPLSKSLIDNKLPSLYELHMAAFENKITNRTIKDIKSLKIEYNILLYSCLSEKNYLSELYLQMKRNGNMYKICNDGYQPFIPIDYNAYVYRVLIKRNISYLNFDNNINLVENLMNNQYLDFPIRSTDEVITLKISLLIQGVRLSQKAYNYISRNNSIKDATFNAIDVSIFDGLKINCPINIPFSDLSPYHIEYDSINTLQLYYRNSFISNIKVDTNENILIRKTSTGIPYSSIGFKTNDRVRIRHTSVCYFKEKNQSCSFCESKHMKQYNFTESEIYEVIDAYEKEISFRHYLIGGASEKNDIEPIRIKKIIQYIRKKSSKPIYLMSLPPKDISHIYDYYQLGLNEVAFNIEIYDRKIASKLMPGKGQIPLKQYMDALEESTKYFAKTGNVRSMLIVGLESEKSLMTGIKDLCSIGVSPMLSIFRPMPLTTMKHIVPPTIESTKRIYKMADNICRQHGLFLGPACDHCKNNTLSLASKYWDIK